MRQGGPAHANDPTTAAAERGGDPGSALDAGGRARPQRRRRVLVFGRHDRRVLPTLLPVPGRRPAACRLPRHNRRRQGGRVPALPALPSGRADGRGGEHGARRQGLPHHRGGADAAVAGRAGGCGTAQRGILPPAVQADDRADASGLCGVVPGGAGQGGAAGGGLGDRHDPRGRLRLQRALLRRVDRHAGDDAATLPGRRRGGGASVCGGAVRARRDPDRVQ